MRLKRLLLLLSIPVLSGGYYQIHRWQQREAIRTVLAYGRLAALPSATTDVQVDTKGGIFSRTFWLKFEADEAAINNWVTQSTSLSKQTPCLFTSTSYQGNGSPGWFVPQSIKQGLLFNIPPGGKGLYGTVWIDAQNHMVYITTSHS